MDIQLAAPVSDVGGQKYLGMNGWMDEWMDGKAE